jgi:hypothetical protein
MSQQALAVSLSTKAAEPLAAAAAKLVMQFLSLSSYLVAVIVICGNWQVGFERKRAISAVARGAKVAVG